MISLKKQDDLPTQEHYELEAVHIVIDKKTGKILTLKDMQLIQEPPK